MIYFIVGIIAALGALFAQLTVTEFAPAFVMSARDHASTLALLIIGSAFIEETAKLLAIRRIAITTSAQILVRNAILVGLGFVVVEFTLIALTPYSTTPFSSAIFLGAPIIHITSPVMIALFLRALATWNPIIRTVITLIIATLIHASYNLLASAGHTTTSTISLVFIITVVLSTAVIIIGFTRTKSKPY